MDGRVTAPSPAPAATVGEWLPAVRPAQTSRRADDDDGPRAPAARAGSGAGSSHPGPPDRRDGPGLHALPRDGAGFRGGLLRPAVASAAAVRALRRRRLRRSLARAG